LNKNTDLLLLLKSSGIGDGEPDLGEKLMKAFLSSIIENGQAPDKIICLNSAIYLTTEGSQVVELLSEFESTGTEIFSCGTCLDYYNRTDKLLIGKAGNMNDTLAAMLKYKKVLSP